MARWPLRVSIRQRFNAACRSPLSIRLPTPRPRLETCSRGHALHDPANLRRNDPYSRHCRICHNERELAKAHAADEAAL